jgi:LacI family transcriptional regulator
VVSFDGSELAEWLRPRVTSVALPFAEMGARAVELVLGLQVPPADGVVLVDMPLQPGGSVASG